MNALLIAGLITYSAVLALIVGIILIAIGHRRKIDRIRIGCDILFDCFNEDIIPCIEDLILDTADKCLDLIPGKLNEIKKEMEA